MAVSTLSEKFAAVSDPRSVPRSAVRVASPAVLRSVLIIGCVTCALVAAGVSEPASLVRADPQLAWLLRGMALLKSTIVLAAIAVISWRFSHPVRVDSAVAYILGAAVLAGATTLIWQLSLIPFAAMAFHIAALMISVTAWRDGASKFKRAGRPHNSHG